MSANDKTRFEERKNEYGIRGGVLHPVITIFTIFVLSFIVLILFSYSGVKIPIFSVVYNELTAGLKSGGNTDGTAGMAGGADAGEGTGVRAAGGEANSGGGGTGVVADGGARLHRDVGGAGLSALTDAGGDTHIGADGAMIGYADDNATDGVYLSDLKGSGGAWDGERLRMPFLSLSYDVSEETEFCLYTDYLAECSRDSFSLLNKDGAETYQKNVDFKKPAMCKRGDYLLVFDRGGRSAFIMKGVKLVWEDTFANGIVNAAINKNGCAAFVLDAVGYRSVVKIFAPAGTPVFDWVVADDYVLYSEVAPSGKELLINRLMTDGLKLRSGIEFLDMKSEPLMMIESGEGEVFLCAAYLDNNSLAVVSERILRLYSERGELALRKKFDLITAFIEFPHKKAVAAVWHDEQTLVIEYDSATLKDRVLYAASQPVVSMSADEKLLFINLGGEVVVLRDNDKIASNLILDAEARYGGASEKFGVLAVNNKSADVYAF